MNFIKKFYVRIKNNREMRNSLCDDVILKIEDALQHIFEIFADTTNTISLLKINTWKSDTVELLKIIETKKIKKFRKAKKYRLLVEKQKMLLDWYNGAEQKAIKNNRDIINRKIEDGYRILGKIEDKVLDMQQMECVVKDDYNQLVIAGAGTGKTTTIVGKAKYLIKLKKCLPEEILVLSFTNVSASEMKERIIKEVDKSIEVSTFHKLAMNIITKVEGKKITITKLNLHDFIKEQLKQNLSMDEYLNLLIKYFLYNRITYKSEFEFKTQEEYEEYLRCNPPTTMKNETVKSYGEMDIANFLYQNNIEYVYESPYKYNTSTNEYTQYTPDFYLPEEDIYIEYFGIDRDGEVPSYFNSKHGKSPSQEYQDSIDWKRNIHKKNNTTMIECYAYEKMEETLLENLQKNLFSQSIRMEPKNITELWNEKFNNDSYLESIIELFGTLINLIKSNNYTIGEVKELSDSSSYNKSNNIILSLLEPIYNSYASYLKEHHEFDFNDMINIATDYINKGKYTSAYKYVIIDEYQDISKSRFNLIKSMRKSNKFHLFCVGDDWQSIYRFAGSDINFILNFGYYWGDFEISKIENTYRFSQKLIEISSNFIQKNPLQIRKNICGNDNWNKSVIGEINGYNEKCAVEFMLNKLNDLPSNSTVFFIGRYSFDYKILQTSDLLNCKYNSQSKVVDIRYSRRKDLKMNFITAHKSKGLQADYVFIINNKNSKIGFPSKVQDVPILELLLDSRDTYLFAEERRIFYVAMTRAKNKVFFLTVKNQESIFINELKEDHAKELKNERYECPICGGRLLQKNGPYGKFIGCENFNKQNCTYKRNIIGK